jgi:hypothetical protein
LLFDLIKPMKITALFRPLALPAAAFLFVSKAHAHPGHDGEHGGGLTWDFTGGLVHVLTSPYHMVPALVTGALAFYFWRRMRAKRAGSHSRD